jgi:hypothetical protein
MYLSDTSKYTKMERICYVSQGAKSMMYTLWQWNIGSQHCNPEYLKNLSTNKDAALAEAEAYAKSTGRTLVDESYDELNKIKRVYRWTPTMVKFGKNRGIELKDCEPKFILWVAKGCPLLNKETNEWEEHQFGGSEFCDYAQELSVELGLGVIDTSTYANGRFYTIEQWQKIQAKRLEMSSYQEGHFYNDKQRVNLDLQVISIYGYESQFGYVSIYKMIDNENRVFVYKGTTTLNQQISNIEGEEKWNTYKDISKNDSFSCVCTIKHNNYKGTNTTYIQRLVIKDLVNQLA